MEKNKKVFEFVKKSDYRKAKERVEGRNYAFCRQQKAGIIGMSFFAGRKGKERLRPTGNVS
jgi:hypothetical protein